MCSRRKQSQKQACNAVGKSKRASQPSFCGRSNGASLHNQFHKNWDARKRNIWSSIILVRFCLTWWSGWQPLLFLIMLVVMKVSVEWYHNRLLPHTSLAFFILSFPRELLDYLWPDFVSDAIRWICFSRARLFSWLCDNMFYWLFWFLGIFFFVSF